MPRNLNKCALGAAAVYGTLLLSSSLMGCSQGQSAETLVAEAKQYQQKGDTKAAVIQLKNAAVKSPENAEVRLLLGNLYMETGDLLSAEKELRKAISLGMQQDRALPALGKVLLAEGQAQKALDETASAAVTPELSATRGEAYLRTSQPEKAKAAFDITLKADPANVNALLGMARFAMTQDDTPGVARYVEEAVAKNPKSVDALLFKAATLRVGGKGEAAIGVYDQVLALQPANRIAHVEKATLHISARQFDAARADIAAATKITPNTPSVLYAKAMLDFAEGKTKAVLDNVQKILRAAPEHLPTLLLAGLAEQREGLNGQAEQHLKKYLEGNPSHVAARRAYVALLLTTKRPNEALTALGPLAALDNAPALTQAGQAYMLLREFTKATAMFEKASALAPEAAPIHTALGMSKLGQGDMDSAVRELELSTKLDASSAEAGIMLAMTELRQNHVDKAMAAAVVLEKAQPSNPIVQNLKGSIYLAKRDVPNATASFEKALALQPAYFPAVANLAQLAMVDKKPEVAKKHFETFLEQNKKSPDAMRELAALAQMQGHPEQATTWLEKSYAENPDAIAPAMQLTAHYLRSGQAQKALPIAAKFQTANPTNPEVLDMVGQVQLASGNQNAALEAYSKLVNVVPKSPMAHYRLGSVHMRLKNEDAAVQDLKKALEIAPDYYEAHIAMAQIAVNKRNFDQAIAIARQIQKIKGRDAAGHLLEGDILMTQNNREAAIGQYEKAFAITKSAPVLIKLSSAMRANGKEKQADARLVQWQKDKPNDVLVPMFLAEGSLGKAQYKVAINQFEAILKKQPGNVVALNNLAWAYQKEKDPRALATAEQANRLAANRPEIIDTLGWMLVEQGNLTRGLPLLQQAVDLAPQASDIRFHLASGLLKAGDKVKARKELERVVADATNPSQQEEARTLLKLL